MKQPHGRIVSATRPIVTSSGKAILGTKPMIICYVKTGSRRMRDQFQKLQKYLGLEVKKVQDICDSLTAYEVVGSAFALEELTSDSCVQSWEYPLNSIVARRAH